MQICIYIIYIISVVMFEFAEKSNDLNSAGVSMDLLLILIHSDVQTINGDAGQASWKAKGHDLSLSAAKGTYFS